MNMQKIYWDENAPRPLRKFWSFDGSSMIENSGKGQKFSYYNTEYFSSCGVVELDGFSFPSAIVVKDYLESDDCWFDRTIIGIVKNSGLIYAIESRSNGTIEILLVSSDIMAQIYEKIIFS